MLPSFSANSHMEMLDIALFLIIRLVLILVVYSMVDY